MTYVCKCGSKQLVRQRVDSDWHCNPAIEINELSCYDEDNKRRLDRSQVICGVSATICLDCGHEGEPWSDGSAPGNKWLLVKDKWNKVHVAKLEANPCVWVDQWEHVLVDVQYWRPL